MDPSLERAYRKLGEVYTRMKQPAKARQSFERYLKFMPGNVTARSALDMQ
jgi:Tfp pilus assembly protein PilF